LFYVYGMYSLHNKRLGDIIVSVTIIIAMLMIVSMAIAFFVRSFAFPRTIFVIAALIQWFLLIFWRIIVFRVWRRFSGKKDVIVLGRFPCLQEVVKKLLLNSSDYYNIKYIIDTSEGIISIDDYIEQTEFVFICSNLTNEEKEKVLSICMAMSKHVYIIPDLFEISLAKARLIQFDDIPAFYIDNFQINIEQRIIKRVIDILCSLAGIVILAPVFILTAVLIKLTSKGSIFYIQDRITNADRIFKLYKFRSMVKDAEKITGPVLAGENDSRITGIGRIIRKTRIDELPQLFNILKGDMSIVGPRPERKFFIDKFKKDLPEYGHRFNVKAGLTGLAQVLGKYTTSVEDKLRYDLLYIRNYSIWMDIKIILQTLRTVFKKESAEGTKEPKGFNELLNMKKYEMNLKNNCIEIVSNGKIKECNLGK
jgi:exopolysaccharide biosynthesis polyprenyl glycosylphosphotransferase